MWIGVYWDSAHGIAQMSETASSLGSLSEVSVRTCPNLYGVYIRSYLSYHYGITAPKHRGFGSGECSSQALTPVLFC